MTRKVKNTYLIFASILILVIAGAAIYKNYFSINERDRRISSLHKDYYYLNLYKDVAYTGNESCKSCHLEIHDTYHQTGMGRSLYKPSPGNEIEDYTNKNTVYDAKTDYYYQNYKKGSVYFQKEFRKDKDGKITHELERKVDYIIGSGNSTRSYLYSENGFLYEMPVSWFTEKAKWDMSPGYEKFNLRFSRPIIQECLNCHNSYSGYVEFSENKFDAHLHEGISCERCHGPGELHIRRQKETGNLFEGIESDTIDRTIVNPANLPLEEELSVCFQCHLQGDVRVFADDKKQSDFRPGMRLRDVKTVFVQDDVPEGDFKIASHAARMFLSKCFSQSDGGMTCITCHDPHVPVQTVSNDFFNGKCLNCHSSNSLSQSNPKAEHEQNSNCVSCHMKQGATKDVQHVNFTDHWIRREIEVTNGEKPDKKDSPERNVSIELKNFNNEMDQYAELNKGIAYVNYYETKHPHFEYLKKAIPLLEENLKKFPSHRNGMYHLGVAYLKSNRYQEAISIFQKLADTDPDNASAYYQLGTAYEKSKNIAKAIESFEKSLAIFPGNVKALNNLGNLYYNEGRLNDALATYLKVLDISSNNPYVLNNLGDLNLYGIKNIDQAKTYLLKAIGLDPDFIPALINLGNVYMLSGDTKEAENIFKQILEKDKGNIQAMGNLAVIYEDRKEFDQAKKMLLRVLEIDPNDSRARQMLEKINK